MFVLKKKEVTTVHNLGTVEIATNYDKGKNRERTNIETKTLKL